ncbi:hypothetical protein C8J34_1024 [Rhizobium sp. PP-F2F-G36]|nr:hypothetical protein C8J34_1024 [Rhizobium sp. PP-F2F-G36]
MASALKSEYYRVKQVYAYDTAVVVEVREGDNLDLGGSKVIRNTKLCLGGVDSYWHITGMKSEGRHSARGDKSSGISVGGATMAINAMIRGNKESVLPAELHGLPVNSKLDAVSYSVTTANRLMVGFSPDDGDFDEVVALLQAGKLSIQTSGTVDAIEVRKNVWMTGGFRRQQDGTFGLAPLVSIRSAPVSKPEGRLESIRLSSGLVVFQRKPSWSPSYELDLRSKNEIMSSAEAWLSRLDQADSAEARTARADLARKFESYVSATVDDEEQVDLQAALKHLSGRRELAEIVPRMLLLDPEWAGVLETFRSEEHERLRSEIRDSIADEATALEEQLSDLRAKVRVAEEDLRMASHREVILRNESERLDSVISGRIAEAAKQLGSEKSDAAAALRDEVQTLREELARLEQTIAVAPQLQSAPQTVETAPEEPIETEAFKKATAISSTAEFLKSLAALASTVDVGPGQMMAAMLVSMEDVMVLAGPGSARAAAEFASLIGGDDAAIVFCDPTHVSLQDIMDDEAGGFAKAVSFARENPDIVVPVALCGITASPCEYWLPRIVEMRRLGRLPRNLSIIASAGDDGLRIPVPDSVLRYLAPFKVAPRFSTAASAPFNGFVKLLTDGGADRKAEAVDVLTSTADISPDFIKKGVRLLSRVPSSDLIKLSDVAAALSGHDAWLQTVGTASDNEFTRFFKNMEG